MLGVAARGIHIMRLLLHLYGLAPSHQGASPYDNGRTKTGVWLQIYRVPFQCRRGAAVNKASPSIIAPQGHLPQQQQQQQQV